MYTISTKAPIKKGDEVYISYGSHSNDFLLAEYGFIMDENAWDEVTLDEYILPMLSEAQKNMLRDAGFFGKYVLDRDNVCYRTQVVLRILVLPVGKWRRFVGGGDDGEKDQGLVDERLSEVLENYKKDVKRNLENIEELEDAKESQKETLRTRWEQIDRLLQMAVDRIK